jgi:hypothetical protein
MMKQSIPIWQVSADDGTFRISTEDWNGTHGPVGLKDHCDRAGIPATDETRQEIQRLINWYLMNKTTESAAEFEERIEKMSETEMRLELRQMRRQLQLPPKPENQPTIPPELSAFVFHLYMLRPEHDTQNPRGQDLANFVIAVIQLADKDVKAATIVHELKRSVQHFPQLRQLFKDVQPITEEHVDKEDV